jgi:hypothetical protein
MSTSSYRPPTRMVVTHIGHLAAEPAAPDAPERCAETADPGDHRALIDDVAQFLQRRPRRPAHLRLAVESPDRGMWPINGEHSSAARLRDLGAAPRRGGGW